MFVAGIVDCCAHASLADHDVCISVALVGRNIYDCKVCGSVCECGCRECGFAWCVYEYECGLRGLDCDCGASVDCFSRIDSSWNVVCLWFSEGNVIISINYMLANSNLISLN